MRLAPLLSVLALAACATLDPDTARDLAATDPLTADPAQIAVALLLPAGLRVPSGSAVLTLGATRAGEEMAERFALVPDAAHDLPDPLPGGQVVALALAPGDAARLRATQAAIAAWKAEGPARGVLRIAIAACAIGPAVDPTTGPADGEAAALIRLGDSSGFRPLAGPAPLAAILGGTAIGPCPGPAQTGPAQTGPARTGPA